MVHQISPRIQKLMSAYFYAKWKLGWDDSTKRMPNEKKVWVGVKRLLKSSLPCRSLASTLRAWRTAHPYEWNRERELAARDPSAYFRDHQGNGPPAHGEERAAVKRAKTDSPTVNGRRPAMEEPKREVLPLRLLQAGSSPIEDMNYFRCHGVLAPPTLRTTPPRPPPPPTIPQVSRGGVFTREPGT